MRIRNTEDFIQRAKSIHGDRFDYSPTQYTKLKEKVIIICPDHGEFSTYPNTHLGSKGGTGCKECALATRRMSPEEYVQKAKEIHGDKFDYSQTRFTKMADQITVLCKEHGEFTQNAQNHLRGMNGCSECNGQSVISVQEYVTRAKEKHGDRFDYSKVMQFKNLHEKITVICNEHRESYRIEANSHLRGNNGCRKCNKYAPYDTAKFDNKIQSHGSGKYDYSKVDLSSFNVKTSSPIICTIDDHGTFYQSFDAHFAGKEGCRKCDEAGTSKREKEFIEFIMDVYDGRIITNDRKVLNGKELDIYLPEINVAIEFNGIYWHQEKFSGKKKHSEKYWACHDQGIRLLTVWEDDWNNKKEIVKKHVQHVMGINNQRRIYARNTNVSIVDRWEASAFHESNHIQGSVSASEHWGLKDKGSGVLVAIASFKKAKNGYILERYSTSEHVIGGHSKIVKAFMKEHPNSMLTTFADLSFSDGGLYEKTGWIQDKILPPDYYYIFRNERKHKFGFRKKRFKNDPSLFYDESLTESQLAHINGIQRVYDCGKIRFTFPCYQDRPEF